MTTKKQFRGAAESVKHWVDQFVEWHREHLTDSEAAEFREVSRKLRDISRGRTADERKKR